MSSGILRHAFRRRRDGGIKDAPIEASRGVAYIQPWQERRTRSGSRSTDELEPAKEVTMKVQTDVKAGGGFGLLGITAIILVDVDVNFGSSCGGCGCRRSCGC
jgi:hypothetical protein